MDLPKSLTDPDKCVMRAQLLDLPHVAPLANFVRRLRAEMGPGYSIPDFDPLDGGVNAQVMFLLEAPGPKAVASGFVSRNNPDETAKNLFLLCQEAGLARELSVVWNIVPWYIGKENKIRPATSSDIREGGSSLGEALLLLPQVRVIVLVGGKAARAENTVRALRPSATVFHAPHPSPMFVNRAPQNRSRILAIFRQVAANLANSAV